MAPKCATNGPLVVKVAASVAKAAVNVVNAAANVAKVKTPPTKTTPLKLR